VVMHGGGGVGGSRGCGRFPGNKHRMNHHNYNHHHHHRTTTITTSTTTTNTTTIAMDVWRGVAMDSLKFH
jgi:hypothetical protein